MLWPQAFARLHVCQREEGISGHAAEVGVYHGRSFIPLALLCGPQASICMYLELHTNIIKQHAGHPIVITARLIAQTVVGSVDVLGHLSQGETADAM